MNTLRFSEFQSGSGSVCVMKQNHELCSCGVEPHIHQDFYELIVVRAGRVFHLLQGNTFRTLPGDVFLIPPMVPHSYIGDESLSIFNVLFLPSVLERFRDELADLPHSPIPLLPGPVHIEKNRFSVFIGLMEELCAEQKGNEPGRNLFLLSGFLKLLLILSRYSVPATEPAGREGACFARIAEVLARMEKDYARAWSMEELAAGAGCSLSLFRRQVREMTGDPPVRHLLRIRLRQARRMLQAHSFSVTEVASLCGFADSNYFCRCFRKEFGISPRECKMSGDADLN